MIATIGSLVQVPSQRPRWFLASSMYATSAALSGALLGAVLGGFGTIVRNGASLGHAATSPQLPTLLLGGLAVAYSLADLGFVGLPRPRIMASVPVTWWRHWQPYRAAAVYGATLGLGLTTRVAFGALYVVCAACLLSADIRYGAALMGTYGAVRGVSIFPSSLGLLRAASCDVLFAKGVFQESRARVLAAVLTAAVGATLVASASHF